MNRKKNLSFDITLKAAILLYLTEVNGIKMIQPKDPFIAAYDEFIILCETEHFEPLVACGIQVSHYGYYDFSLGDEAKVQGVNTSSYYLRLRYHGSGLKNGQCGVTVVGNSTYAENFGCRGRTKNGAWQYDYVSIFLKEGKTSSFNIHLKPHNQVFRPGSNVTLTCDQKEKLTYCGIILPTTNGNKEFNSENRMFSQKQPSTEYIYTSNGEKGKCKVRIYGISEKNSEWVVCTGVRDKQIFGRTYARTVTHLIVARPPTDDVILTIKPEEGIKAGDVLEAECAVDECVPPANITWYWGGVKVAAEDIEEVTNIRWRWNFEPEERTQRIKRTVSGGDNGLEVTCEVSHIGMDGTFKRSLKLLVAGSSIGSTQSSVINDVTVKFGLIIGLSSVLSTLGFVVLIFIVYRVIKRFFCKGTQLEVNRAVELRPPLKREKEVPAISLRPPQPLPRPDDTRRKQRSPRYSHHSYVCVLPNDPTTQDTEFGQNIADSMVHGIESCEYDVPDRASYASIKPGYVMTESEFQEFKFGKSPNETTPAVYDYVYNHKLKPRDLPLPQPPVISGAYLQNHPPPLGATTANVLFR